MRTTATAGPRQGVPLGLVLGSIVVIQAAVAAVFFRYLFPAVL